MTHTIRARCGVSLFFSPRDITLILATVIRDGRIPRTSVCREALGLSSCCLSCSGERESGGTQTGAGPVGSTDIKICGRTGREVTRFFIAVQVQREGRRTQ